MMLLILYLCVQVFYALVCNPSSPLFYALSEPLPSITNRSLSGSFKDITSHVNYQKSRTPCHISDPYIHCPPLLLIWTDGLIDVGWWAEILFDNHGNSHPERFPTIREHTSCTRSRGCQKRTKCSYSL